MMDAFEQKHKEISPVPVAGRAYLFRNEPLVRSNFLEVAHQRLFEAGQGSQPRAPYDAKRQEQFAVPEKKECPAESPTENWEDEKQPYPENERPLHTKTSIGIILCRINSATQRPEVVLVHKRYSYAFAEFVHGRYSRHNTRTLAALLDGMTTEELLDVLSLNFDQMWFRIWQLAPKEELYRRKLTKFQSLVRDDGGARLQDMVRNARALGELLWEVPKGKNNPDECDILCAVRELQEEAGVEKKDYRILPHYRRRTRHTHMGTAYVGVYYVAIANPWLARVRTESGRPDRVGNRRRPVDSMTEVSDARWMDILQIRVVDSEKRIENLVAPVFKLAKLFVSGKWLQTSPSWEKRIDARPIPDQQICAMLDKKLADERPPTRGRARGIRHWTSMPQPGAMPQAVAEKAPPVHLPPLRSANSKLVRNAWKTVTYTRRNKNAPPGAASFVSA